jgi:integrase/recombinase XerD
VAIRGFLCHRHHHLLAENGGAIEHPQQIVNHESPRVSKLNNRASDAIGFDEIERILI